MKLHLGAGCRYIPGFVHVDIADYPHIQHRCGVDRLPMFDNDSVELIYASHVLEYFDRQEGLKVLTEWLRVLKVGGVLRLAVPDAEALMQIYQDTKDLSLILGPLYGRMFVQTDEGEKCIYHRTVYDYDDLSFLLQLAGFSRPRLWDWRTTEHASVDDFSQSYLPHMEKEHGRLMSLNVEADK